MNILFVNWSPLWRGAKIGGGVNVYTQHMAIQLAQRGHHISAVNAGYSYDFALRSRVQYVTRFHGVQCYEIVNAPILAPGFFNASWPQSDIHDKRIEALFKSVLTKVRPEVVHFNNIEGFTGYCIEIAKQFGARVIYSLHNYHPICNQINLLYQNHTVCLDFQRGERCVDCMPKPPPRWRHKLRRRVVYYLRDLRLIQNLQSMSSRLGGRLEAKPVRSKVEAVQFRIRREQMISCLNHADLILAVSSWVRDVYVRQGLDSNKTKVNHIGSAIASVRQTSFPPSDKSDGVVRIGFMGVAGPHKGLPLLLKALAGLKPAELKRIDLAIHARGVFTLDTQLDALRVHLAALRATDGYRYNDIPKLLADRDFGIVAPIWWDNAPQVVFEFLAMGVPVIGAKIGGIPDFITHNGNGLLFEPGNVDDLTEKLRHVLATPGLKQRLRRGIKPMKTIAEHADELEAFYSGSGS